MKKKLLILLIFIFALFLILFIFFNESNYYQGEKSDHFNGKNFFNPSDQIDHQKRNFFSYYLSKIQYQKQHGKTQWPNQIIEKNNFQLSSIKNNNNQQFQITYVGHSTFLLQHLGLNILFDPIWSNRASPFSFIGPKRITQPGIKFEDLPKIDLVLISHSHYDHMDLATIKKLHQAFQPKFITGLGNCYYLNTKRKLGLDCQELDWQDKLKINQEFSIHFLPAKHWSKRMFFGRNASLWGAFVLESIHGNVYFAGDTGYDQHFKKAQKQFKKFKIAFLPIGAYKPENFMLKYHISPSQAIQAHLDLNSNLSIAMHYQTFPLSSENFNDPIIDLEKEKLIKEINQEFITLERGKNKLIK